MKTELKLQNQFVTLLRMQASTQVNLARDIAELLEISSDGAYRRLRCETAFSLDEAVRICMHYSIPLEALNSQVDRVVTFQFSRLDDQASSYFSYLKHLSEQLQRIDRHPSGRIHYASEDIPMFYHFGFSQLGSFKSYYWMKSILNVAALIPEHFPPNDEQDVPSDLLHELYDRYARIPSTEIWSDETIESTLQQVKFYWDAGFFASVAAAHLVLDDIEAMMQRIARQAETGQKIGLNGASTGAPFQMYLCDLMIGNNSIYIELGETAVSFIGYNTFNAIQTRNEHFNEQHLRWMENLRSKSIQISGMAEKIRNQFFKAQRKKIDELRAHIHD
jgi:hypothetical protein